MKFDKCYLDLNNMLMTIFTATYDKISFSKGEVIHFGTTLNFLKQVLKLKRKFNEVKTWIAVGEGGSELKTKLCPEYKSNRKPMEKNDWKRFQQERITVIDLLQYIGISFIRKDGLEADEIIFNLIKEGNNLIISNDNDFYSCLRNGNAIYKRKKLITKNKFKKGFEIEPELYSLLQALVGKGGSSIPGVEGIGNKRATEIIKLNKNNFFKKLKEENLTGQPKLLEKLYDNKKLIKRNYKLFANIGSDTSGLRIEKVEIDKGNKRLKALINKFESLFTVI